MKLVDAYNSAALEYGMYRLSDWSQHYDDDVISGVEKMEKPLEINLLR